MAGLLATALLLAVYHGAGAFEIPGNFANLAAAATTDPAVTACSIAFAVVDSCYSASPGLSTAAESDAASCLCCHSTVEIDEYYSSCADYISASYPKSSTQYSGECLLIINVAYETVVLTLHSLRRTSRCLRLRDAHLRRWRRWRWLLGDSYQHAVRHEHHGTHHCFRHKNQQRRWWWWCRRKRRNCRPRRMHSHRRYPLVLHRRNTVHNRSAQQRSRVLRLVSSTISYSKNSVHAETCSPATPPRPARPLSRQR